MGQAYDLQRTGKTERMGIDMFMLRICIADAINVLRDEQLGVAERLRQAEAQLALALAGSGELPVEEVTHWLVRPGVAATIERVSREGGNGLYFEANEDSSPSDRPIRAP